MNCKKCGNILNPNDIFCQNCGEKIISESPINYQLNNNELNNIQNNQNMNLTQQNNYLNQSNQNINLTQQNDYLNQSNQNINLTQQNDYLNQNNQNMNLTQQNFSNDISKQSEQQNYNQNNMMYQNESQLNPNFGYNQLNSQPYVANSPEQSYNEKKKNSSFKIIVIVLAVIIIILAAILVSKNLLGKENSNIEENNDTNPVTDTNNDNTNINSNVNTVKYKNFIFPIPENYVTEDKQSSLMFTNQSEKIITNIVINSGYTLDDINQMSETIRLKLESGGYTVNSVDTREYAGKNHLVFFCTVVIDGVTVNMADIYSNLGKYSVVESAIFNVGNMRTMDEIITTFANMYNNTATNDGSGFANQDNKEEINTILSKGIDLSVLE